MSAAPPDLLVRDVIAAEMATVLAERAALKRVPGTHAKQAELMAQASDLFDQMVELDG